jgi:hypothetical protein
VLVALPDALTAELMAVALSSVEGAGGVNSRIVAHILQELKRDPN